MKSIVCRLFPVNKVIALEVDDESLIETSLYKQLGLQQSYLERIPFEGDDGASHHFIVRTFGGGKGGFRKQLEKKGREFARMKREKQKAERQLQKSKKTQLKSKTKADTARVETIVETTDGTLKSDARELAQQGLRRILSRIRSTQ